MPAYFPSFLDLRDRGVLVVGGLDLSAPKIDSLLRSGANVTLVARRVSAQVGRLADKILIQQRNVERSDLDGVWYVVSTAPRDVNVQLKAWCDEARLFMNAVDDVDHLSALAPAILERGAVTIAVTTHGKAPALAGLVRQALEQVLPTTDEMQTWSALAESLRTTWKAAKTPMSERRPALLRTVADAVRAMSDAATTASEHLDSEQPR